MTFSEFIANKGFAFDSEINLYCKVLAKDKNGYIVRFSTEEQLENDYKKYLKKQEKRNAKH